MTLTSLVVEFANELPAKLREDHTDITTELLLADIGHNAHICSSLLQKAISGLPSRVAKDLDRHGRDLWNLCVRLKRDQPGLTASTKAGKLLVRTRVLGFHMIELARHSGRAKHGEEEEAGYMMKLALALARTCLEQWDLDLARATLQKAAEFLEKLKPTNVQIEKESLHAAKLEVDYLTLRIILVRPISS